MYLYVYMYTYIYLYINIYIYIHIHVYIYVRIHVHMYINICILYTHMHTNYWYSDGASEHTQQRHPHETEFCCTHVQVMTQWCFMHINMYIHEIYIFTYTYMCTWVSCTCIYTTTMCDLCVDKFADDLRVNKFVDVMPCACTRSWMKCHERVMSHTCTSHDTVLLPLYVYASWPLPLCERVWLMTVSWLVLLYRWLCRDKCCCTADCVSISNADYVMTCATVLLFRDKCCCTAYCVSTSAAVLLTVSRYVYMLLYCCLCRDLCCSHCVVTRCCCHSH